MFTEGWSAQLEYRSLHEMYQTALRGWPEMILDTLAGRTEPHAKLHGPCAGRGQGVQDGRSVAYER